MKSGVAAYLRAGNVALVSTDTVLGLAALPDGPGYAHIFELKCRPADQALPWLVAGTGALDELCDEVPAYARRLAAMLWPGQLTLVLKASKCAQDMGSIAADGTIALRCPNDEDLLELLRELDAPLACTSANKHGEPTPSCLEELPEEMRALAHEEMPLGFAGAQSASTIVDCTGAYPRILREGPIPSALILNVAAFGATLCA